MLQVKPNLNYYVTIERFNDSLSRNDKAHLTETQFKSINQKFSSSLLELY